MNAQYEYASHEDSWNYNWSGPNFLTCICDALSGVSSFFLHIPVCEFSRSCLLFAICVWFLIIWNMWSLVVSFYFTFYILSVKHVLTALVCYTVPSIFKYLFTGEDLMNLERELKHQKKFVKSLKKRSLWSMTMEEVYLCRLLIIAFDSWLRCNPHRLLLTYGVDLLELSIADHGQVCQYCSIHASKNDGGFWWQWYGLAWYTLSKAFGHIAGALVRCLPLDISPIICHFGGW